MVKADKIQYFEMIINNICEAIWVVNSKTFELTYASDSMCSLSGFQTNEMLTKHLKDLLTQDSYLKISRSIKNRIIIFEADNKYGGNNLQEITVLCQNGTYYISEANVILIPNKYGKVVEILFALREIYQQKKLQSQLFEKDLKIIEQHKAELLFNTSNPSIIEELTNTNHFLITYNEKLLKTINENFALISRLNEAQNTAKMGSWEWEIQTGEIWWSEQLYQIFELSANDYTPTIDDNLNYLHPEDINLYNRLIKNCLQTGNNFECDFRIITAKRNIRNCNCTGKVQINSESRPIRFMGTFMDITARKMAEDSLRKMDYILKYFITETSRKTGTDYFRAMVKALCVSLDADYAHIGFIQNDGKHIKTLALGDKKQNYPNIEYEFSGNATDVFIINQLIYQANESEIPFSNEIFLNQKDLKELSGVPLLDHLGNPAGVIVCLFNKPVTDPLFVEMMIKLFADRAVNEYDRLKNLEELVAAREKAEESDKLKTIFLQNMSHEIRTPMNAIIGFSELIDHNLNDKNKLHKFSHIIQQSSKELMGVISDILDYSRIESGQQTMKIETCDINLLFNDLEELFTIYQHDNHKDAIHLIFYPICDPEQSLIRTDKDKIKQIFINLITNAFKFTEEGKIEIGCSLSVNHEMQFYVADSGKGIAQHKQPLIFDRFMQFNDTTSNLYGGTGLGLSIVKGLVDLMGGEIWLKSEEGVGSRFSFTFYYQLSQEKEIQLRPLNPNENRLKLKKVLIVEDDIFNAEYLIEILTDFEMVPFHVSSGKDALQFLQTQSVDLVLMDISLPEMNGYDVTKLIKQKLPDLCVIAQTAFALQDDRQKALDAGCDDYLAKPVNRMLLFKTMQAHLSKT